VVLRPPASAGIERGGRHDARLAGRGARSERAQVAWGVTNTGPDVQDLYIEQLKADDPAQYRTPSGWARFETAQEVIKVKGQPDVSR
jgi:hypothetical protein